MANKINNKHTDSSVYVDGYGDLSYKELRDLVAKGAITETIRNDDTGKVISKSGAGDLKHPVDYNYVQTVSPELEELARTAPAYDPYKPNNSYTGLNAGMLNPLAKLITIAGKAVQEAPKETNPYDSGANQSLPNSFYNSRYTSNYTIGDWQNDVKKAREGATGAQSQEIFGDMTPEERAQYVDVYGKAGSDAAQEYANALGKTVDANNINYNDLYNAYYIQNELTPVQQNYYNQLVESRGKDYADQWASELRDGTLDRRAESEVNRKNVFDYTKELLKDADNENTKESSNYTANQEFVSANATDTSLGQSAEDEYRRMMNDDERKAYNLLYNTQGRDAAEEYYNRIKSELQRRATQSQKAMYYDLGQKDPLGSTLMSIVSSPTQVVNRLGQLGQMATTGQVNENDLLNNVATNEVKSTRAGASDEIYNTVANKWGWGEGWGNAARFGYGVGTSMGDFAFNMVVGNVLAGGAPLSSALTAAEQQTAEAITLGIMGSGAASNATLEAKEEGKTDAQAMAIGSIAGFAEIITEKVSIDTLLNSPISLLKGKKLGNILKNAVAEGSEEVASDLINTVSDVLINGDRNKIKQRIYELINEGKSEQEAFGIAIGETAGSMAQSGLAGAVSGAGMGAGSTALYALDSRNAVKAFDLRNNMDTLINAGVNSEGVTKELADRLKEKQANGEKISDTELYGLFQSSDKMVEALIPTVEKRMEDAQTNRSEVMKFIDDAGLDLDMPIRTVMDKMYLEGQSVPEYVTAMHDYYNAGLNGLDIDSVESDVLNEKQKQAIYEFGVEEREAGEDLELPTEELPEEVKDNPSETQAEPKTEEPIETKEEPIKATEPKVEAKLSGTAVENYLARTNKTVPDSLKQVMEQGYNLVSSGKSEMKRGTKLSEYINSVEDCYAAGREGNPDVVSRYVDNNLLDKSIAQSAYDAGFESTSNRVEEVAPVVEEAKPVEKPKTTKKTESKKAEPKKKGETKKSTKKTEPKVTETKVEEPVKTTKKKTTKKAEPKTEVEPKAETKKKTETKKDEPKAEPKVEPVVESVDNYNARLDVKEAVDNFRYIVRERSAIDLGDDFFDNIANGESDYDTVLETVQSWEDNGDIDEADFPNGFRELERLAEQLDEYMEEGTPIKYSRESKPVKYSKESKPTKATEIDSEGRPVNKNMQEYMKNSYARTGFTKDGSLKEMYHGTPTGTFTRFKGSTDNPGYFFSDNIDTSTSYSHDNRDITPDRPMSFDDLNDFLQEITYGKYYIQKGQDANGRIRIRENETIEPTSRLSSDVNEFLNILKKCDPLNAAMYDLNFMNLWLYDEEFETYTSAEKLAEEIINGENLLVGDLTMSLEDEDLLLSYGIDIDDNNEFDQLKTLGIDSLPVRDGEVFENVAALQKHIYDFFAEEDKAIGFNGIYKAYLNCENPLIIEGNGANWYDITLPVDGKKYSTNQINRYAYIEGYDSVIFKDIWDGGAADTTSNVIVVFNPEQAKSIYNQNPTTNTDLRYERATPTKGKKAKPTESAKQETQNFHDVYGDETKWTTERDGDKNKKPMSLTDIVAMMQHALGANITYKHMRAPDGVLGQFNTRTKGIRLRLKNSLPTICHELGHYLDDKYNITTGDVPQDVQEDLIKALGKKKDNYTQAEYISEGQAEYFRNYFTNRNETVNMFPKATEWMLSKMTPKELATIDYIADEVNAYYSIETENESSVVEKGHKYNDPRTIKEKLNDKRLAFYLKWTDSAYAIKAVSENAYTLATNSAYAGARVANIITNELRDIRGKYVFKGLAEILAPIDTTNEDLYHKFNDYLVYQHGIERVQNGKRVFANDTKNNVEYMQKKAAELEQAHPEFKQIAEELYEFEDKLVQEWAVKTGLISKKTYNAWKKLYKKHVPLNRVMDDVKGKKGVGMYGSGVNKGFGNQSSTLKSTSKEGSSRDIIYPVDNIMDEISHLVTASTRNDVMLSLRSAALDLKDVFADIMEQVPDPMKAITLNIDNIKDRISKDVLKSAAEGKLDGTAVETIDDILDSMSSLTTQFTKSKNTKSDVVSILVDGELEFWKINDQSLLESVTNMNKPTLDGLLRVYGKTTRFLTANLTGNNPIWSIFSNAPRDLMTFVTYMKKKNFREAFKDMAIAYINEMNDEFHFGEVNPLHAEYLAMGGGHDSLYSVDEDMAQKARKKMTSNKVKKTIDMLNPINIVSFFTDMIENGPREATYIMCRNQGMTPEEAFYESREITVNFAKSGTHSRQINQVIPFFNASVQGIDKMARYFSAEDIKGDGRAKVAAQRTGMLVAASSIIAMMFYAMNNRDEESKKQYQTLSTYMKNSYFNIPLGDYNFFSIPKPREIAVLTSFFERAFEYTHGDNKEAFNEFYDYVSDNCLPSVVNDLANFFPHAFKDGLHQAFKDSAADALGDLGVIGTLINVVANRDFLGRPIVSDKLDKYEPKDQFNDSTSKVAHALGQALNLSPMAVDYLGNNILGYIWKIQKAWLPMNDANRDPSMGVGNSYFRDALVSNDITNKIYELQEKSEKASNSDKDNADKALLKKKDDNMASFWSRFSALNKGNKSETSRNARAVALQMLSDYYDARDKTVSGAQRTVEDTFREVKDTEILPSVMQTNIKNSDKETFDLSDKQYYEYQTKYLNKFYEEVEKNITKDMTAEEKAKIIKSAKDSAKAKVDNEMLSEYFHGTVKDKSTKTYDEVHEIDLTTNPTYQRYSNDRLYSGATKEQQEFVDNKLQLLASNKTDADSMTIKKQVERAEQLGISSDKWLLFNLARKMVDKPNEHGNLGTYTTSEEQEAAKMVGINYQSVKKIKTAYSDWKKEQEKQAKNNQVRNNNSKKK